MNKKKSLTLIIGLVLLTTSIQASASSEKEKKEHKEHKGGGSAGEQHGKPKKDQTSGEKKVAPAMQTKSLPTQSPAVKSSTSVPASHTPPAQHSVQATQPTQQPPATGGGLMAPAPTKPVAAATPKQDPLKNMSEQLTKLVASTKQQMEDMSKLDQASLEKKKTELLQEHVNKATDLDQAYTELKRLSQSQDAAKNADAIQIQLNRIILDATQMTSISSLME